MAHPASVERLLGALSCGGGGGEEKQPGHTVPSSATVKNEWSCTTTPP